MAPLLKILKEFEGVAPSMKIWKESLMQIWKEFEGVAPLMKILKEFEGVSSW